MSSLLNTVNMVHTYKCLLILKFWCNNAQNILSNSHHSLLTKSSIEENCFELLKNQNQQKQKWKKQTATKQYYFGICQSQCWESLHENKIHQLSGAVLSPSTQWFFFNLILLLEIWQNLYFLFEVAITVLSNKCFFLLEGPKF